VSVDWLKLETAWALTGSVIRAKEFVAPEKSSYNATAATGFLGCSVSPPDRNPVGLLIQRSRDRDVE
jgi:hypothetical protein